MKFSPEKFGVKSQKQYLCTRFSEIFPGSDRRRSSLKGLHRQGKTVREAMPAFRKEAAGRVETNRQCGGAEGPVPRKERPEDKTSNRGQQCLRPRYFTTESLILAQDER
jgi:hypothetical protein